MIAGHTFDPITDKCTGTIGEGDEKRVCGVHWISIRNVTEADVGLHGIAHAADLTGYEYDQIRARRDAENARYDAAIKEAVG